MNPWERLGNMTEAEKERFCERIHTPMPWPDPKPGDYYRAMFMADLLDYSRRASVVS